MEERFLLFRVNDNTVRKQTEGYGSAQVQVEKERIEKAEDEKALQVRQRSLAHRPDRIYASIDGLQNQAYTYDEIVFVSDGAFGFGV